MTLPVCTLALPSAAPRRSSLIIIQSKQLSHPQAQDHLSTDNAGNSYPFLSIYVCLQSHLSELPLTFLRCSRNEKCQRYHNQVRPQVTLTTPQRIFILPFAFTYVPQIRLPNCAFLCLNFSVFSGGARIDSGRGTEQYASQNQGSASEGEWEPQALWEAPLIQL